MIREHGRLQNRSEWREGDLFQLDEPLMGATWYGRLERRRSGDCWITLGIFVPWKRDDGSNVSDFWNGYPPEEVAIPSTRQLGSTKFSNPDDLNVFNFLDDLPPH
jgi:hypothetical protein